MSAESKVQETALSLAMTRAIRELIESKRPELVARAQELLPEVARELGVTEEALAKTEE